MRVRNTVNLHCIKMAHWTIVGSKNKQANNSEVMDLVCLKVKKDKTVD